MHLLLDSLGQCLCKVFPVEGHSIQLCEVGTRKSHCFLNFFLSSVVYISQMSSQSISFSELLCLLDSKLVDQTLNPELANWIGRPVIP